MCIFVRNKKKKKKKKKEKKKKKRHLLGVHAARDFEALRGLAEGRGPTRGRHVEAAHGAVEAEEPGLGPAVVHGLQYQHVGRLAGRSHPPLQGQERGLATTAAAATAAAAGGGGGRCRRKGRWAAAARHGGGIGKGRVCAEAHLELLEGLLVHLPGTKAPWVARRVENNSCCPCGFGSCVVLCASDG